MTITPPHSLAARQRAAPAYRRKCRTQGLVLGIKSPLSFEFVFYLNYRDPDLCFISPVATPVRPRPGDLREWLCHRWLPIVFIVVRLPWPADPSVFFSTEPQHKFREEPVLFFAHCGIGFIL